MKREQITPQETLDEIADEIRRTVRNSRDQQSTPYYRLAVCGLIAGTAVVGVLGRFHEVTNESEGDSELVAIQDRMSVVISEHQKYVYTHYEDDQPGPIGNPQSTRVGIFEQHMEYIPDGLFKMTAKDDEDLGFFVLMEETDGVTTTPFKYDKIIFSAAKPEPCDMDTVDNKIVIDEYCTPLEDPESRGLEYSDGWQGGAFFNDTNITARTRRLHDIKVGNEWCELAMVHGSTGIGGPITEVVNNGTTSQEGDLNFNINNQNISPRKVYLGVRRSIIASTRRDASLQTGLPLTNAVGMPIFLMQEEVAFLKRVAEQQGKPIKDMTPAEYRSAVGLAKISLSQEFFPGEIDPGPTLAMELVEYSEKDSEVSHPENDNGDKITEQNQLTYEENYYCLPFTDIDSIRESERQWWLKEQLGELDGLQPFAAAYLPDQLDQEIDFAGKEPDMTDWPVQIVNLDPVEAQAVIDDFMVKAGLKEAGDINSQLVTSGRLPNLLGED